MNVIKFSLLLVLICAAVTSFGQIDFSKGYVIDKNDQRIECLIKNHEWRDNPRSITYRLNENGEDVTGTLGSIREFQVYGFAKYVKGEVKIDRSPTALTELTAIKTPMWSDEVLFLKVLVEGKATLYEFVDGTLFRYFYSVENKPVQQLVWKEYLGENTALLANNTFRQQLWTDVKCDNAKLTDVENLRYNASALVKYFLKYNACYGGSVQNEKEADKKTAFNLKLAAGVNISSMNLKYPPSSVDLNFDQAVTPRVGLELEVVMPFNRNKFSLLLEPTYQYYQASQSFTLQTSTYEVDVDYSYVDLPLGIRYYSFLTENTKLFVNAHYVFTLPVENTVDIKTYRTIEIGSLTTLGLGLGFEVNRFSAEVRYYLADDLTYRDPDWTSKFNRLGILAGYKFYKRGNK